MSWPVTHGGGAHNLCELDNNFVLGEAAAAAAQASALLQCGWRGGGAKSSRPGAKQNVYMNKKKKSKRESGRRAVIASGCRCGSMDF